MVKELKKAKKGPKIPWTEPDGEDIHVKMKKCKGAGSPDGWHGMEIKHFPREVADTFSKIAGRWKKARKGPEAVKKARQCNLIKESKITKEGTIEAGNLRPISVISVWWRVITSCWVTSTDLET